MCVDCDGLREEEEAGVKEDVWARDLGEKRVWSWVEVLVLIME